MHKRNVNTESAKSNTATEKNRQNGRQQASAVENQPSRIEQIWRQVQEIETRTCDIEILLETVFEKIDGLASAGPAKTLDAINTLATCALRNVALIKEHYEHIGALTIGGAQ